MRAAFYVRIRERLGPTRGWTSWRNVRGEFRFYWFADALERAQAIDVGRPPWDRFQIAITLQDKIVWKDGREPAPGEKTRGRQFPMAQE